MASSSRMLSSIFCFSFASIWIAPDSSRASFWMSAARSAPPSSSWRAAALSALIALVNCSSASSRLSRLAPSVTGVFKIIRYCRLSCMFRTSEMKKQPPGDHPVTACPLLLACPKVYIGPRALSSPPTPAPPAKVKKTLIFQRTPTRTPRPRPRLLPTGPAPPNPPNPPAQPATHPPPPSPGPAQLPPCCASIARHLATLRLCSARVAAKACPPVPSATKNR